MAAFDLFITLDGNCLNGFEGLCGVARLRCDPDADRWEKQIHFFEGVAGGHATQVNPTGTLAFLGNLSQTLLFFVGAVLVHAGFAPLRESGRAPFDPGRRGLLLAAGAVALHRLRTGQSIF